MTPPTTKEQKKQLKKQQRAEFFQNINDSDKQRALTVLAYMGIIALSILTSAFGIVFDFEKFDLQRFITNTAFNVAFSIIALFISIKDGRLSNETRRKGALPETKKEFSQKASQIVDHDGFRQWNDYYFNEQRLEYIRTELASAGVYDIEYLYITDNDLLRLKSEPLENIPYVVNGERKTVTLDTINDLQYELINIFRKGKFTFKKINFQFFTTQEKNSTYKYFGDNQDNDAKAEKFAFIWRVASLIMFGAMLGLSAINRNGGGAGQVAYETTSRITNIFTSMFMGYSLTHDEAIRTIKTLSFKITVIEQYIVDTTSGIFKPKNRDEIIQSKLNEIRANKQLIEEEQTNTQDQQQTLLETTENNENDNGVELEQVEYAPEEIEIDEKDYANYLKWKQAQSK